MFILCSIVSPVITLAAGIFTEQQRGRRRAPIVLACLFLGLTYDVFNTLGTNDSYRLFEVAGIVAYDNLTPSMQPPYYGREVTIAVQVATGALLFFVSLLRLVKLGLQKTRKSVVGDKVFLINTGILIFAVSFIVGSLAKQWWIYYAVSIVTALLFGGSVLIDVKEVHHYYEKLIPFIKEDIIHNVAFSEFSKIKLTEMLACLGKSTDLNTFVVLKIRETRLELSYDFAVMDGVLAIVGRHLNSALSAESFLVLPLSNTRVGIALRLPRDQARGKRILILGVLEDIREEIHRVCTCGLTAGIVVRVYERRSKVLIQNAKAHIEATYQSPISYRDVAREICISPSYFLSLFKRETGMTFVDYLTHLRITRARKLLLSTELSITEIAFRTGFNNSNYFSSLFRRIVGVSAKEYRSKRTGAAP